MKSAGPCFDGTGSPNQRCTHGLHPTPPHIFAINDTLVGFGFNMMVWSNGARFSDFTICLRCFLLKTKTVYFLSSVAVGI